MTDSGDRLARRRIASGYRVMRTILGGTKARLQPKWNSNESNSLTRHVDENSFRVPSTYRTLASEERRDPGGHNRPINIIHWRTLAFAETQRRESCGAMMHRRTKKISPCARRRIPENRRKDRHQRLGETNPKTISRFLRLWFLLNIILQVFHRFRSQFRVIFDLLAQTYFPVGFLCTRRTIANVCCF